MKPLHATLSPNRITDVKKTVLTLKFDSPEHASGVKVKLVEKDAGVQDEGGEDDVIAIFEGRIVKKLFQGRLIRSEKGHAKAPTFRFQFEGDSTVHTLHIPSGRGEEEKGAYEIGVEVTGTRATGRRGKTHDVFRSKAPAFLRNLPGAKGTAEHRPVVTFHASDGDPFYQHAKRFWTPVSDWIEERRSLEEIVDFLNDATGRETKDGMAFGKWGEINIVTHANEDGWAQIRLLSGDGVGIDENVLAKGRHSSRLRLRTSDLDGDTRVVWRGCKVGHSSKFLSETRALFGGKCKVYGPLFLQAYRSSSTWSGKKSNRVVHAWEFFEENFYFDIPWKNTKRRPKLPSAKKAAEQLEAKYPGINSAKEWRALYRDKSARHDSRRPREIGIEVALTREQARDHERYARDEIAKERDHKRYAWKIRKPVQQGDDFVVQVRGASYRVEVRRPLRGVDGEIVVPSLDDTSHYSKTS